MRFLLAMTVCSILRAPEPGEGGGGGGGNPPAKTFTQEDLDASAAATRRSYQQKLDAVEAKLAEQNKTIEGFAETKTELQKLKEANMSADERAQAARERAEKAAEQERTTLTTERDAARAEAQAHREALRETVLRQDMSGHLVRAKVASIALDDAYAAFRREATFEYEEGQDGKPGKLKSIVVDGAPYTKPDEAVKAWVRGKPYFVEAPANGGGGGYNPGPGQGGRKLSDLSDREVAEAAHEQSFGAKSARR